MDCLNDAAVDLAEWLAKLLRHVRAKEQLWIGKASQAAGRIDALRDFDASGLGSLVSLACGVFVTFRNWFAAGSPLEFCQSPNLLLSRQLR